MASSRSPAHGSVMVTSAWDRAARTQRQYIPGAPDLMAKRSSCKVILLTVCCLAGARCQCRCRCTRGRFAAGCRAWAPEDEAGVFAPPDPIISKAYGLVLASMLPETVGGLTNRCSLDSKGLPFPSSSRPLIARDWYDCGCGGIGRRARFRF